MPTSRNLRRDLAALGLLALVLFLATALFTYDPADPVPEPITPLNLLYQPDALVAPQNAQIHNVCGRWGALAADMLFAAFGAAAWYLLLALGVLDLNLLRRQTIDTPLLRGLGFATSLLGVTTLLAMLLPSLAPGPVIGSGGYLGALGKGVAYQHFAQIGGVILAGSLALGGLLLATDYALFRAGGFSVQLLLASLMGAKIAVQRQRKAQPKTDLDEPMPGADGEPSVRVKGKKGAKVPARDDLSGVLGIEEEAEELQLAATTGKLADEDEEDSDVIPVKKLGVAQLTGKSVPANSTTLAPKTRTDGPENPLRVRNPADKKREAAAKDPHDEVRQRLDEASLGKGADDYELPGLDLLLPADDVNFEAQATEVRRKAKILEKTFLDFGFTVKVVEIETGPVIAQYEVELEAGLRLSKITGLADDLAIALRVPSVRIVAPIPGKNTVGIEVPNEQRQVVRLREVIEEANGKTKKMRIPIFLGKDVSGNPLVVDLSTLPHLLIAGRTGTGKSVCLNAIISSILMTRRPDEVRMLMIDPKMVELSGYGRLPHLMHPVVTDMRKAEAILAWGVEKMEERYALLARAGVRHISSYNQLGEEELFDRLQPETDEERQSIPLHLPFIVIVADEIADLMMQCGKEVEQHIIRLAQKSRAVGIHLILATQKPTVDVITGLIKSNLPARIAFQVASRTDSRVVLDEMGADKLLGNGDMLFLWPGTSTLLRGQGTYLSDDEINKIVDVVSTGEQNFVHELVNMKVTKPGEDEDRLAAMRKKDDMYESAVDVVIREGRGSVSLLQRSLGIGYGRAARLIDFMAEDGIVGTYAGSQAREVLISVEEWEAMQAGGSADEGESSKPAGPARASAANALTATQPKKRNNRVLPEREIMDEESLESADEEQDDFNAEDDPQDESLADESEADLFARQDDNEDRGFDGYEAESA